MKKIFIILTIISILTSVSSCKQDDLLDVENRNSLNAGNFWRNQNDAEAGIYSVYSALQFSGVMGGSSVISFALLSESGRIGNVGDSPETIEIDDALVNSANNRIFTMWRDLYRVIFRANQVLENVPNIEMDETAKREILGEAYFLRGIAMFWLGTTFNQGNVPYPLVAASNLEETRGTAVPKAQVFEQIIDDLLKAQENLTGRSDWANEGLQGRATWGAATSILGKVYLYEENFTRAAEEFKKVIDSGQYQLTENIGDNFNEAGEHNRESIFEVQFFVNVEDDGAFGDGEGRNNDESTLRSKSWARGFGGFSNVFATHFISSLYRNEVLDPSAPINTPLVNVYEDGYDPDNNEADNAAFIIQEDRRFSVRSEASMAYEGDGTLFYGITTRGANGFVRVVSRGQTKKFMNILESAELNNSGINERVIRYADVLLMYAEALLRSQGDAGVPDALTYINMVRQRSGLVTLENLFNGVPTAPIILNTFPDLRPDPADTMVEANEKIAEINTINDGLDPTLKIEPQALNATNILRHLFNKERPAEFAWEGRGICWHDLRRRPANIGTGVERIRQLGEVIYTTTTFDVQNFEQLPEFIDNSLQDFRQRKVNFNEQDYFFPIPAQELIQNPGLNSGN
ncbi:RagB/SusD family nutrient uptake outer membrane protein [Aquimarina sp. AU119]|uniref:RagB/SusD family nutrient uptake outer membrane protein n=1 Tax=Aquimarina sp. AU119 TaxID=2108528 RepID=UPI000D699CF8|nr:RagB/SusD family nutrient uptake outer membrane protein [Aquimarina sp. AU119]